jgi:hypothetical protein
MLVDMNSVTRCMVVSSASLFSSPHNYVGADLSKAICKSQRLSAAAQLDR